MLIFMLVVAILGDVLLAILLWAVHTDVAHQDESAWLVRRTFMHLREGSPLVGDERYVADSYLGHPLVEAIQNGRVGTDGKEVAK